MITPLMEMFTEMFAVDNKTVKLDIKIQVHNNVPL